jgi:hypothetical protein
MKLRTSVIDRLHICGIKIRELGGGQILLESGLLGRCPEGE